MGDVPDKIYVTSEWFFHSFLRSWLFFGNYRTPSLWAARGIQGNEMIMRSCVRYAIPPQQPSGVYVYAF